MLMNGWAIAGLAAVVLIGSGDRGPASQSDAQDPVAIRFASLANAARVEAGCTALQWHDGAAAVARSHSSDMRDRGYFSHTNPDGADPFDRLEAAGIGYVSAAENILAGEATATRALGLWMKSPGHRANLIDCSFTHHGVGRADTHWTHIFLRPASP